MTHRHVDHAVAALARKQHGAFSRRQAEEAGATRHVIAARRRAGHWMEADHGVFVLDGHPRTWEQRCMAATLGMPAAVVSGRAAAALHELEGCRPGRPQITVPRSGHHESRLAIVRQSDLIDPVRFRGIPVNSAALTFFELAHDLTDDRLEAVLEAGLRTGQLDLAELCNWYVRLARSRRPGIGRVRALLDARGDGAVPPASELERVLYGTFDVAELQPLVRQARFPWRPRDGQRVDALLPASRIILEADGRAWHGQLTDLARDRRRDRDALTHGYVPLRFTWIDLTRDPQGCLEVVRRMHHVQLAQLGVAA